MSVEVLPEAPSPRPYRFELLPDDAMASALELLEQPVEDGVSNELEGAVARGLERALAFTGAQAAERRTALALLAELTPLPLREMELRLEAHRPRFRSAELCQLLFSECAEEVHHAPQRAVELSRLALKAVELIESRSLPPAIWHDLRAEAWAVAADTLRLAGNPRAAERAFRKAESHLESGSGTLMVRASLLLRKASLACDLARYDRGLRAANQALTILRAGACGDEVARALVAKGRLHLERGHAERARPSLEEAVRLAEDGDDRALSLAAHQNLAVCLYELGQPHRAQRCLAATRVLAKLLGRPDDPSRRAPDQHPAIDRSW